MPPKRGKDKSKCPADSPGSSVLQQGPHGKPGTRGQKRKQLDLSREDPTPLDALESASKIGSVPIIQTTGSHLSKRTKLTVGPHDNDFRECILEPRGITIDSNNRLLLPYPYPHFASGRTAETKYKEMEGFEDLNIWLETDTPFLSETAAEYECMRIHEMCEAEFASFGKERLLKGEPRNHKIPEDRKF